VVRCGGGGGPPACNFAAVGRSPGLRPPPFLCGCAIFRAPLPLLLYCRLTYWVIFALFSMVESFSDRVLFWFPMYYSVKVGALRRVASSTVAVAPGGTRGKPPVRLLLSFVT